MKVVCNKMSGMKSFLLDIGNLLMDPKTSDLVLVCQGEEIKAHRCILSARSPVFGAMLQNGMLENINSEIKIDDADRDVVKEMLHYMYKVEVSENFTKFKELLVLADKYQVGELVKYCGTKIVESLNKDNVFLIGSFAETHNAEDLTRECIKFVLEKASEGLNQDWEDQIKKSPKMMLQFLKHFMKEYAKVSQEVSRLGRGKDGSINGLAHGLAGQQLRATAFQVDSKVKLCGVGMFGTGTKDDFFAVDLKVLNETNECLLEETKAIKADGTHVVNKLIFSQPVPVEANRKYHITVRYSCPEKLDILFGTGYNEVVHSSDEEAFKVTFSASSHDQHNPKNKYYGPFPTLYFCK